MRKGGHDDHELQQLDIKAMEKQFKKLTLATRDSLKRRNVPHTKLIDYLFACPFSSSVVTSKSERSSQLLDWQSDLKNSKSIDEIFTVLAPFWSFLDFELLEDIIKYENLEADCDWQSLEKYINSLKNFLNSWKVQPYTFSRYVSESLGFQVSKLCIKLDTESLSLSIYQDVKAFVAQILGVSLYDIRLVSIEEGYVELVFLCPEQALQCPLMISHDELQKTKPIVLKIKRVDESFLFQVCKILHITK